FPPSLSRSATTAPVCSLDSLGTGKSPFALDICFHRVCSGWTGTRPGEGSTVSPATTHSQIAIVVRVGDRVPLVLLGRNFVARREDFFACHLPQATCHSRQVWLRPCRARFFPLSCRFGCVSINAAQAE